MQRAKEFQRKLGERKFTGGVIENLVFVNKAGSSNRKNLDRTYALNANNFPVVPIAKDVQGDTEYKIKQDLRNAKSGIGNAGSGRTMIDNATPVPWTDRDTNYFKKKSAAEDQAAFAAWCRNRVNLTSSYAELDWAQRTMPFLFDPQEELLEQKLDDCNKYAKIRLRGPQTEDDWEFMYMVETGVIELPKGPVWDPFNEAALNAGITWKELNAPEPDLAKIERKMSDANFVNYKRGLFSPLTPRTPSKGGKAANIYNKNDPYGARGTNYVGPVGNIPALEPDYSQAYGPSQTDPSLGARRYEDARRDPKAIGTNAYKERAATAAINSVPFYDLMDTSK